MTNQLQNDTALVTDVRVLIAHARNRAAHVVHAELTTLYWDVGRRIRREILGDQRAD